MTGPKQINFEKFKNLWKTKKAVECIENKDLWSEIIGYYWKKTWKKQGKVSWRDIAHRVFSEFVRLWYADDDWYIRCITCKVKLFWSDAQAGHFLKRHIMKYTFDITNVFPQCETCNVMLDGNYIMYTIVMINMLGKDEVERRMGDKETVDYNQVWYEEHILEWYKFICDKKKKIWERKKKE